MVINRRKALVSSAGLLLPLLGLPGTTHAAAKPGGSRRKNENKRSTFREFTAGSQKAIKKGNRWLLKAINRDGGAGTDLATQSEVACTSVVGMAFLSQGNTPNEGVYAKQQKGILNFTLKCAERLRATGHIQSGSSVIESDLGPYSPAFFTTLFLSQAMGETRQVKRTHSALSFLSRYVSDGQLSNGSWGVDNAWAPLLATSVGWLSLRAANFTGVKVRGSSRRAGDFLIDQMPSLGSEWGAGAWYHRLYGTAAGLRVLYSLGRESEEKAQQAMSDIMKLVQSSNRAFGGAGGEEYLTFHLLTEMLMQEGGQKWEAWYSVVRDKLIEVQNRDGSWTGHHCITSRTFSTACAMMVLTAPNRYLPISQV